MIFYKCNVKYDSVEGYEGFRFRKKSVLEKEDCCDPTNKQNFNKYHHSHMTLIIHSPSHNLYSVCTYVTTSVGKK